MIDYAESPLGRISAVAWGDDGPPPTDFVESLQNLSGGRWDADEDALGPGLPSTQWQSTVTGATNADPVRVTTSAAHDLADDMYVTFDSVGGMTELNTGIYRVSVVDTTTIDLLGTDGTSFGTYTTGGTVEPGELAAASSASYVSIRIEGVSSGGVYEWHNFPLTWPEATEWRALDANGDPTSDEFYLRWIDKDNANMRIRRPAGSILEQTFPFIERVRSWSFV